MPVSRFLSKKRPAQGGMSKHLGVLSRSFSDLGRLAALPQSRERQIERMHKERFQMLEAEREAQERLGHEKINPESAEEVMQYLQVATARECGPMVRKAMLFVASWESSEKKAAFFRQFLENKEHQSLGLQLYQEYLTVGGKPLGGSFARLDENFRKIRKQPNHG